jgi:hypothetical protein
MEVSTLAPCQCRKEFFWSLEMKLTVFCLFGALTQRALRARLNTCENGR